MGCYGDTPERTPLPYWLPNNDALLSSMTIEMCRDLALARGFTVFGTQYGQACLAGYSLMQATSLGAPSFPCNFPCAGNTAQTCGGHWANSVYEIVRGGWARSLPSDGASGKTPDCSRSAIHAPAPSHEHRASTASRRPGLSPQGQCACIAYIHTHLHIAQQKARAS